MKLKALKRCGWAQGDLRRMSSSPQVPSKRNNERDPLKTDLVMQAYHDKEWGFPLHDDRRLLESLILDGAQAGLSWRTILLRREGYRKAFYRFDARRIAAMGAKDVRRLLRDKGIIRNRAKIRSAIDNARAFLKIREEFGSFNSYIWSFVGGKTLVNRRRPRDFRELPVTSPEAEAMSKDLKKRGFSFVGPTICYAFMQAAGMVDDHLDGCYRTTGQAKRRGNQNSGMAKAAAIGIR